METIADARPEIRSALDRASRFLGLAALVSVVLAAITSTGALDYARAAAGREAQAAVRAIAALPPSACKDSLLELASFSVTRSS